MMHLRLFFLLFPAVVAFGQTLLLPPRPAEAVGGRALADTLTSLTREAREERILSEVLRGNVPSSLRLLIPLSFNAETGTRSHEVTIFVAPDYLSLGADDDPFLVPMTPLLAQRIADSLGCTLPTAKLVDLIYAHAAIRLRPQPIPPGPAMTTVPIFIQHNDSVLAQRKAFGMAVAPGSLVAGHKKDVIISNLIVQNLKKDRLRPVVIYGWHRLDGTPIQPRFNGHGETYADYSHGIRLLLDRMIVDGRPGSMRALLRDTLRAPLISDEGAIAAPFYCQPDGMH